MERKGKASKRKSNQAPLPPGPTPWPIIGNLPEIWRKRPAFRWIHGLMKELHTDILCVRLANTHVVAVTSPVIAREFLKKNDSVFASRPVTMATEYSSRRFLTIAVVPWGDQWKKMRKVVTCEIVSASKLRSLLENRTEEADNLFRFIYNQFKSNGDDNSTSSAVVNLRLAMRQYSGNVMRKMIFNRRYFGEGRKDGGPGYEEEEHVESLFTVLKQAYSFILSDSIPWLRSFDLEGHEKTVCKAMKIVSEYQDPLITRGSKSGEKARRRSLKTSLMPSF
ncbi:Cytochrome p450 79a2, putative [Theobroma cacao]|uniref:Cytochrome p450 79a2, putative n=1 Tax=Theobroma cacao TaxID=3641 RepID=S1SIP6_THECC|nr:Cytochrome p450 79a2, putative [Theobroma cacao]